MRLGSQFREILAIEYGSWTLVETSFNDFNVFKNHVSMLYSECGVSSWLRDKFFQVVRVYLYLQKRHTEAT